MDIFDQRNVDPMLIHERQDPFNNENWVYELKWDGIRCIAYLDSNTTDLRSKRSLALVQKFPELNSINLQASNRCILDGELVSLDALGRPDFYQLQRRSILTNEFKIQQSSLKQPASFIAFDILYLKDREIKYLPLIERKMLLSQIVSENGRIAISRYIEEYGIELYNAAIEKQLEGVVAKRKDSFYYYGKRSRDWVKFKKLEDEDMVICGYSFRKPMNVLFLGQYDGDKLIYRGSVSFGVKMDFLRRNPCIVLPHPPFSSRTETEVESCSDITWIVPRIVCTVEYMPTVKGSLRQPVFKGIRTDILPVECTIKNMH